MQVTAIKKAKNANLCHTTGRLSAEKKKAGEKSAHEEVWNSSLPLSLSQHFFDLRDEEKSRAGVDWSDRRKTVQWRANLNREFIYQISFLGRSH